MNRFLTEVFRIWATAWIFAAAVFTIGFPHAAYAEGEAEDPGLPSKLGVHYPGGYDLNTVKVLDVEVRKFELPVRGPVLIDVTSGGLLYRIVAGPHWFWAENKLNYSPGDRIRVKGSIVQGRDSGLYILAAELLDPDGKKTPVKLRDESGYPLWPGRHRMGPGPMMGPGMHGGPK